MAIAMDPESPLQTSIVIPCYRSEAWLEELVDRLHAVMANLGEPFEIVLVNDVSPDATWQVCEKLCDRYPRLRSFDLVANVGQCRATLCGLEHAAGEIIVTMDDDFQHCPEDVPRLLRALRDDPELDCATAGFGRREQSGLRRLGTAFMRTVYRLCGAPPGFEASAFRALRRDVARAVCACPMESDLLVPILLKVTDRIANVPLTHQPRRAGESGYTLPQLVGMALECLVGLSGLRRRSSPGPRYEIRRVCPAPDAR